MELSNQAVGAIMLALQKGIMEQIDITSVLKGFNVVNSVDGLIIENPPSVRFDKPPPPSEKTVPKKRAKRKTKPRTKKVTKKKDSVDA